MRRYKVRGLTVDYLVMFKVLELLINIREKVLRSFKRDVVNLVRNKRLIFLPHLYITLTKLTGFDCVDCTTIVKD